MSPDTLQSDENRVLVVTPTRRDGDITRDLLGQAGVRCSVCASVAELAARVASDENGAVLLTDVALADGDMPAVIAALSRQPSWSDLPFVVLARDNEHAPVVSEQLSQLTNVTLIGRPATTRSMVSAVRAALRARHWQYRIRDQLAAQQQAERALREADRRKDVFLATLAHELRNPLAPLRSGLQLMEHVSLASDQQAKVRAMMERQVTQLVRLIEDLLDVSRIATGKVVLKRELLDLRAVVTAAVEACQPAADKAGHRLEVKLPDGPVQTFGDSSRLTQVVGNLLNNACKYTPAHGLIAVELRDDLDHAEIQVRDNGEGIPASMLEEVFSMFAQVNQTLDRAQGGLGIGLSLVRRLVELHEGSVVAHSPGLGHGSTFEVRLPKSTLQAPATAPRDAVQEPSLHRRLRILVVDDNRDAADSLSVILGMSGHETQTAYSGEQALLLAETFRPDAVFCDIGMQGMDGHEVASRLRTGQPKASNMTLVAVTGWGSHDDRRRTAASGFDFHLVKPVDFAAIHAILSKL